MPDVLPHALQVHVDPPTTVPVSPNSDLKQFFATALGNSGSRAGLWVDFIRAMHVTRMAEIGVYRGDFAAELLRQCEGLSTYYMVDPWRHLDDWNKPANHADGVLEDYFREAKATTEFVAGNRVILRGKTTEVIDQIADGELDFAYIDADHTLRGIAIDLIRVYPKIRTGGFLGGDDFTASVWEHNSKFEPTLVFPFAVYFAEAVGATIYAFPYSQFCLEKRIGGEFAFIDMTGQYTELGLRNQFAPEKLLKMRLTERFPRAVTAVRKAARLFR